MSLFQFIIGQDKPLQLLTTLFQKDVLPNAIIFTGIQGVGKKTTATAFAMACNCTGDGDKRLSESAGYNNTAGYQKETNQPCGICRTCRKIKSGNHPDIIYIKPSGSVIKIDQIRALCHTLAMKPFEAKLRVVIILEADLLNLSAANALLKVLEEPPDNTVLILTAVHKIDLLPTIVSRCRHVRFNPVSQKDLALMLQEKHGLDSVNAYITASMANGSFSRAVSMASGKDKTDWKKKRDLIINTMGLDKSNSYSLNSLGSVLGFAAMLAKNKKKLYDSLELLKFWFRDLVIFQYYPEKVVNRDLIDKIEAVSKKTDIKLLILKISLIHEAQKKIDTNTNLRLMSEVFFLRLAGIFNEKNCRNNI